MWLQSIEDGEHESTCNSPLILHQLTITKEGLAVYMISVLRIRYTMCP